MSFYLPERRYSTVTGPTPKSLVVEQVSISRPFNLVFEPTQQALFGQGQGTTVTIDQISFGERNTSHLSTKV